MLQFVPYDGIINVFLLVASLLEARGTRHQTGGLKKQGVRAKICRVLLSLMTNTPLNDKKAKVGHLMPLLNFVSSDTVKQCFCLQHSFLSLPFIEQSPCPSAQPRELDFEVSAEPPLKRAKGL